MKVKLTQKVESKIRANARRGARTLDKAAPGWHKAKNLTLKKLDMENSCNCVWGQLNSQDKFNDSEAFQEHYGYLHGSATPGYLPAYDKFDKSVCHVDPRANRDWTSMLTDEEVEEMEAVKAEEWAVLQDEWTQLIRRRRAFDRDVA
jgi:hypothetical protein